MSLRKKIWVVLICGLLNATGLSQGIAGVTQRPAASPLTRKLAFLTGTRDAVLVAGPEGSILAGINVDLDLIPASTLKLLTSLAALEILGRDFRFRTDFYIDPQNNLTIKGGGDPLLVSEVVKALAEHLAAQLPIINNLVLDNSYFDQPLRIAGRGNSSEPYDAPNGALCVNFNTVAFKRVNGRWISDEPQTPLLPVVLPKIRTSGLKQGRITLAADSAEALQYTGALFRFFLEGAGSQVKGTINCGRVDPASDQLVWQYESRRNLEQVITQLLEYSNNFIANQIMLVMGAHVFGPPATIDKGLKVLRKYYLEELKLKSGWIVEASGISRENRITARGMLRILQRYTPYHELMRRKGREYYKTGHLNGIRTRAGYLSGTKGRLYPFVIMINTPGRSTEKIMAVIEKFLADYP